MLYKELKSLIKVKTQTLKDLAEFLSNFISSQAAGMNTQVNVLFQSLIKMQIK